MRVARFQAIDGLVMAAGDDVSAGTGGGEDRQTAGDSTAPPTTSSGEVREIETESDGDCAVQGGEEEGGRNQCVPGSHASDDQPDCADGLTEVPNENQHQDGDQVGGEKDGDQVDGEQCLDGGQTQSRGEEEEEYSRDQTGTMSPKSFATFKGFLVHTPEMNLPWESMRSVRQCTCGVTFSYSIRKVHVASIITLNL